jgi:hypothetical protein
MTSHPFRIVLGAAWAAMAAGAASAPREQGRVNVGDTDRV